MSAPQAAHSSAENCAGTDPQTGVERVVRVSEAPYPGLRPFAREESDIFFGREALVDELLRRLYRSQFLGLVGVSGCGKSSLLRAGLMPALETGFLAGAGVQWRIVELRPGNRPIRRLAEALVPVLGSAGTPVGLDCGAVFDAALRRGPLGLSEVLREQEFPAATNLLLVVD